MSKYSCSVKGCKSSFKGEVSKDKLNQESILVPEGWIIKWGIGRCNYPTTKPVCPNH